jgi:hypothetical protein
LHPITENQRKPCRQFGAYQHPTLQQLVVDQRENLADGAIHINLELLCLRSGHQRSNAPDYVIRTLRVPDCACCSRTRLGEISGSFFKPVETGITVGDDRRQRLDDFVGNGRCQFPIALRRVTRSSSASRSAICADRFLKARKAVAPIAATPRKRLIRAVPFQESPGDKKWPNIVSATHPHGHDHDTTRPEKTDGHQHNGTVEHSSGDFYRGNGVKNEDRDCDCGDRDAAKNA